MNDAIRVDYIGPLPQSARGNRYVLSVANRTSRAVSLCPCITPDANHAVKGLLNCMLIFGFPLKITSDGARHFGNALLKEVCESLETERRITSRPCVVQAQVGMAERHTRDVTECLEKASSS